MLVLAAAYVSGQNPPSFEVASIKPAEPLTVESMRSGQLHLGVKIDAARADFGGVSLMNLITRAYGVRNFQVAGPDFLTRARFDILAKLPDGASPGQVPEMLQTLLGERFKLALHRDTKEFPVYALVVAKDGPKLTPRPADFDPATKSDVRPVTIDGLVDLISGLTDRPIVNKTELPGEYMVPLGQFMREATLQRASAYVKARAAARGDGAPSDAASDPADAAVSGFVKPLGLKLEPRKLPLPLLVIDHLESTPTDN
jgi:uncharacterized protein (TIGR03435 family)